MRKLFLRKGVLRLSSAFIIGFLFLVVASPVYAAGWIQKDSSLGYNGTLYGYDNVDNAESTAWGNTYKTQTKNTVSSVPEAIMTNMVVSWGDFNRMIALGKDPAKVFSGKQDSGSAIQMTVDAVVYGRMLSTSQGKVTYTQFELEMGNPYGIIGAYVYVVFRQAALSLLLVIFIVDLIGNLFRGGGRGRQRLKEDLTTLLLSFAILYAMPFIVDWILYFRNALMYSIGKSFSANGQSGLSASLRESAVSTSKLSLALLYWIFSFVGLFFFVNYVGTALIETVLFGAFPVISIMRTKAKRSFQVWAGVFFPNLFIPLIDSILLVIPGGILSISASMPGGGSQYNAFANQYMLAVLIIACLYAIIPSRNAILRAFGGVTGVTPRSGLGGIMGMAMMAGRQVANIARSSSGGGGGNTVVESVESVDSAREKAEAAEGMQLQLDQSARNIEKSMEDVDKITSELDRDEDLIGASRASDIDAELEGDSGKSGVDSFLESGGDTLIDPHTNVGVTMADEDSEVASVGDIDSKLIQSVGGLNEVNVSRDVGVDDADKVAATVGDGTGQSALLQDMLDGKPGQLNDLNATSAALAASMDKVAGESENASENGKVDAATAVAAAGVNSSASASAAQADTAARVADADASFRAGLNEAEISRFNNLKRMDSLQSELGNTHNNVKALEANNSALAAQRNSLVAKSQASALTNAETVQLASINKQIDMNAAGIQNLSAKERSLKSALHSARQAESQYASLDRAAYGEGAATANAFQDAASFRNVKEIASRRLEFASYKNFDSRQYSGMMTYQQEASFMRQRADAARRGERIPAYQGRTMQRAAVGGGNTVVNNYYGYGNNQGQRNQSAGPAVQGQGGGKYRMQSKAVSDEKAGKKQAVKGSGSGRMPQTGNVSRNMRTAPGERNRVETDRLAHSVINEAKGKYRGDGE